MRKRPEWLKIFKEELLKGERVSQRKFLELCGYWRLAALAHYLIHKRDWKIEKRTINNHGEVEYFLGPDELSYQRSQVKRK